MFLFKKVQALTGTRKKGDLKSKECLRGGGAGIGVETKNGKSPDLSTFCPNFL